MKTVKEIEKMIEELKEEGLDTKSLEIKRNRMLEEQSKYVNVKKVKEILEKELPNRKFSLEKVRVLSREGKIQGEFESKRTGLQILLESVYEYIEDEKMTKDDWKQKYLEMKEENDLLKQRINDLENKEGGKVKATKKIENTVDYGSLTNDELIKNINKMKNVELIELFTERFGEDEEFNNLKVNEKKKMLKEKISGMDGKKED